MSETTAHRALFKLIKQAIFIASGETGLILDANPAAEALTGRSLSDLRTMLHFQLHPSEEAEKARERFAELIRAPQAFRSPQPDMEWSVLHRDGHRIPVDIMTDVFASLDGTPLVLGIFRDVSGRRKAEAALRDSELKYRRLHESITDAIAAVDLAGHIVDCNPAFEAMVGYTAEELRRMTYRDLTPERWHEFEARILAEQVLGNGYSEVYEKEYRRRDGAVFPVELRSFLLRNDEGQQPSGMWAIVRDISERKRAEKELRESEQRFRSLFDGGFDGVLLTHTDGSIHAANSVARAMFGMTEEEIFAAGRDGLIVKDSRLEEALEIRRATGRTQCELSFICKDGGIRDGEIASMVLGESEEAFVILRDITERKRVERALRESEERYRTFLQAATDGFAVADSQGHLREVNAAYCRMTGYSGQELLSMSIQDLETTETAHERAARMAKIRNIGSDRFESVHRRKDGSLVDLDISIQYRPVDGMFVAFLRDITERKRTEQALLRQNQFIQAALDNISDGVVACDGDGNLALLNRAAREWHGIEALQLPPDRWASQYDLFDIDGITPMVTEAIPLRRAFDGEQLQDVGMTIGATGKPLRHVLASGGPFFDAGQKLGAVVAMHDITERKQAEAEQKRLWAELAHAQKMECVGRLAGGVAHDFNNLMSVILMHADSALGELEDANPAREAISAIQDAAEKAVAIGRQLMSFSQKQVLQTEILELNSVIAENHKLIRRLIGEDVRVVFTGSSDLLVKADAGQIGQIIVNLAVNSRDAMPNGGTFEIEACRMEFDDADLKLHATAKVGSYAVLKVRDDGIGMDAETQARAFEPFFTTKGVGKGTGLGLSVIYGIVNQMDGFITLDSEPGKGTEFRIHLPIASEAAKPSPKTEAGPVAGGSETVLLAEDEPALREKIRMVLAGAGYRVLVAADGNQALQLIQDVVGPIDLLVTDVVMPEISGFRLADRLRVLRPQTRVLFMSGYPDPGDGSLSVESLPNLLQKPFTKEKLLRQMRAVLDGSRK